MVASIVKYFFIAMLMVVSSAHASDQYLNPAQYQSEEILTIANQSVKKGDQSLTFSNTQKDQLFKIESDYNQEACYAGPCEYDDDCHSGCYCGSRGVCVD